jgi:hypothetical protein
LDLSVDLLQAKKEALLEDLGVVAITQKVIKAKQAHTQIDLTILSQGSCLNKSTNGVHQ